MLLLKRPTIRIRKDLLEFVRMEDGIRGMTIWVYAPYGIELKPNTFNATALDPDDGFSAIFEGIEFPTSPYRYSCNPKGPLTGMEIGLWGHIEITSDKPRNIHRGTYLGKVYMSVNIDTNDISYSTDFGSSELSKRYKNRTWTYAADLKERLIYHIKSLINKLNPRKLKQGFLDKIS